jgi:hypothetical protein
MVAVLDQPTVKPVSSRILAASAGYANNNEFFARLVKIKSGKSGNTAVVPVKRKFWQKEFDAVFKKSKHEGII